MAGCKSAENSKQQYKLETDGTLNVTRSNINKEAIRLKGVIEKDNGVIDNRNNYDFRVQEIVQFGATFSSIEPKVGDLVKLMTPKEVSFAQNQVVLIDARTPRTRNGGGPLKIDLIKP